MTSIRTRLFRSISLLIFLIALAVWASGSLFMEDYYLWQKKQDLLTASRQLAAVQQSDSSALPLEMNRLASQLGIGILLRAADGSVLANTFAPPPFEHDRGPQPPPPPGLLRKTQDVVDAATTIDVESDAMLRIDFLSLRQRLPNGDSLQLRLPLPSITESAAYANRLLSLAALLFLVAGSGWAYVFSRKFTAPLVELNDIAQNMARLDFSRSCSPTNRDEIGTLGASINHLSERLAAALQELKRNNEALTLEIANEKRLDSMRKTFVSSVSHELKTPLALILGYAEGLQEAVASDAESRDYYATVIVDEAKKMDRLLRDLLNLSQMENGYFHLEQSDFDLAALLDAILPPYLALLQQKNVRFERVAAASLPVYGDMLRSEQVLQNLLANAADHVNDNGQLALRCEVHGNHLRVSVFNSGSRIPVDALEQVWHSFYKADPSRSRSLGGYGLGLSIVRAIQDLHGNGYGVANVDDGVLFWVDFRRSDET